MTNPVDKFTIIRRVESKVIKFECVERSTKSSFHAHLPCRITVLVECKKVIGIIMIRSSHIFFSRKPYRRPLKVFQSLPGRREGKTRVVLGFGSKSQKSHYIFSKPQNAVKRLCFELFSFPKPIALEFDKKRDRIQTVYA